MTRWVDMISTFTPCPHFLETINVPNLGETQASRGSNMQSAASSGRIPVCAGMTDELLLLADPKTSLMSFLAVESIRPNCAGCHTIK